MNDRSDPTDTGDAGEQTDCVASAPRRRPRIDHALLRTINLSLTLVIGAELGLAWLVDRDNPAALGPVVAWWVFALAFTATELAIFDIELDREQITFTFAEIPLVIGLFLSSPLPVLMARLVGTFLVLVLVTRQMPRKMLLNITITGAECIVAFLVFDVVSGGSGIAAPRSWLAAGVAMIVADLTALLVVHLAMTFHGAPVRFSPLIPTTLATALTNTSLAITGLLLLQVSPLALLPLIAVVGIVIMAWHSYATLAARLDSMSLLYDFTRLVAGSQHSSDVVAPLLGRLRELLAAEFVAVHLLDRGDVDGSSVETWMDAASHQLAAAPGDLRQRLVAFERANPQHARYSPLERHLALAADLGRPDGLAAALYSGDNLFGVLIVDSHRMDLGPFAAEDARLFDTLSRHAASALDNAKLIDRLRHENRQRLHEARHDPLTGLPNRADFNRRFADLLDEAADLGGSLGVGLIDLDKFKQVNDTLGHHVGDLLLTAVAERLRIGLEAGVLLARLGGDEFALLAPQHNSPAELLALGIRIEAMVRQPFNLDGHVVEIGASIGFSCFPQHGHDPVGLLRNADHAMYRAKQYANGHHVEVAGRDQRTRTPSDR